MFLENPLYSLLDKTIHEFNAENSQFSASQSCKSYDKQKGDDVHFYSWDIKSDLKSRGGIIFSQRKYEGMLEFTYNKNTKVLTILQTPYIVKGETKIPAMTGDISSIIRQKLDKIAPVQSAYIKFPSDTFLAVIDEEAKQQLPALTSTKNCQLIEQISQNIRQEEEKIRRQVMAEKEAKDRHEAKIESLLSKKRSMFGIDPADYSMEDFDKIVSPKIAQYCQNKIANIERHLRANIKAYQDLMVQNDYKKEIYGTQSFSLLTEKDYEQIMNNNDDDPYFTNESCKEILLYDLYGQDGLLQTIKGGFEDVNWEIKQGRYPNPFQNWEYFWEYVVKNAYTCNPVFDSGNRDLDNFTRCADLLYNISSLIEQRKLYKSMLKKSAKILPEFLKASNQASMLMQCPYFIKYNRRTTHYLQKPTYATFMVKPGVKKIDYRKIRYTAGKNADEFGRWKFERRKFLKGLAEGKVIKNVDHMITFVPKSLPFDEIKKLVQYTLNHTLGLSDDSKNGSDFYSYDLGNQYFVCESPDVMASVKEILVQHELDLIKNTSFFHHGCFVMVEPDYYNKYFINTPAGYNYIEQFKKVGAKGQYSYGQSIRDCILAELDKMGVEYDKRALCDEQSIERIEEYYGTDLAYLSHLGSVRDVSKIDFDKLKETILGSYSSPKESDIKITMKYDPNEPEEVDEPERDDEYWRELDEQEAEPYSAPKPRPLDYDEYIPFGPSNNPTTEPEDDDDDKIPF